jgi:AcrR family transcriptional regulator
VGSRHIVFLTDCRKEAGGLVDERSFQDRISFVCKVFFQKGYHPTSIREISEAAGMSMGQLYHYISTKDDVLFLMHRHMQTSWYKYLTDNLKEDPDDPVQTLTDALRLTTDFHFTHKKLIQFVYLESKYLSKQHLKVVLQMDDQNVVQFWRNLLVAVQRKTGLDIDINACANIIVFLNVFMPLRGWNLKDRPAEEYKQQLLQFALKAIGIPVI